MLLDIRQDLGSIVFACEAIWIFAFGQEHHLDIDTLFEHHIQSSQCSFDTCTIAVVEDSHILGETMDQANLWEGEGCTTRRHHILDARLHELYHI